MEQNNEGVKWLYDRLKGGGYDIGDEQEFKKSLANKEDREWYYKKAVGMGLEMGTMDEFDAYYAPAQQVQSQQPVTPGDGSYDAQGHYVPGKGDKAAAKRGNDTPSVAGVEMPSSSGAPTQPVWKPSEQEKVRMINTVRGIQNEFNAKSEERMDNTRRMIQSNFPSGRADLKRREERAQLLGLPTKLMGITPTPVGTGESAAGEKGVMNPKSPVPYDVSVVNGKPVTRWLLPDGRLTSDLNEADAAEGAAKAARKEYKMQKERESIDGRIKSAEAELAELQKQYEDSKERVYSQWEKDYKKNEAPLATILAGQTYVPRQQSDKENAALEVAIRQKEELLKDLREEKDRQSGKDVGFWRGFGRAVADGRTWDLGVGDLKDAMTMMNSKQYAEPTATEGERKAGEAMMKAIHDKQEAEQLFGGNSSWWNRAGGMAGYMPSFMVDFYLTGGGFEGLSKLGGVAAKQSAKVFGEKAIKEIAELGVKGYAKKYGAKGVGKMAGNWMVKALGTTADELLIRAPLMTNTVQGGKTAADIIDRKLGDVVVDEDGNYDFSNDKTWGSAVWQGEANAIIENYSEMFGTHLDKLTPLVAKTFGGKRMSGMLARLNASNFGAVRDTVKKHFSRLGMSDSLGEISEEYYGHLWRSMLGLDDAFTEVSVLDEHGNPVLDEQGNPVTERKNLFFTGQFHGDIWGGMALSMGLMGIGKYGITSAGYSYLKHEVNKADRTAANILKPEKWESLRKAIDATTNEDIGNLAHEVISDSSLSDEELDAVMTYMECSLNFRGLNLANVILNRGAEESETSDESYKSEESEIKPVGKGVFGDIYEDFKGRIKDAVKFLYKAKSGETRGVFNREEIGEIGLIWGDEQKGLSHIIEKHIIQNADFDSVQELMSVMDDVINNGDIIFQKGGNCKIEKGDHRVVIARKEDGSFVITAYDRTRGVNEKRRSRADETRFDQLVREEMDGSLVPPGTTSDGKGIENDSYEQYKPGADDYYAEGYSAEEGSGARKDMRLAWENERENLVAAFGEEFVDNLDKFAIEEARGIASKGEPEEQTMIERYLNAKAAYDGVIERVRDDISEEVRKNDAKIDRCTNADTGTVIEVRLTDGRQMWVTSGKIVRYDNGDIDKTNSSDMLIVVDAEGNAESTAPTFIKSIENEVDPTELKKIAAGKISEEMAERASVEIDGIVSFTPGERVRMLTEEGGEPVEVVISGDTVDEQGAPVAGMVDVTMPDGSVMSMSRDDVQRGADAADVLRVSQARALDETDKSDESYKSYKPEEVEIKPVGRGKFGDVFASFRGKAKAALEYLSRLKSGQAKGVFYRPEIGEIDLVWGDAPTAYSGKGLAHIDRKHVQTLGDFSSMEEAIEVIDDVIKNGAFTEQNARTAVFDKDNYRVVVARDEAGNWVLTAFDNKTPAREKKEQKDAAALGTAGQPIEGARAVTPNLSAAGKGTTNSGDLQEKSALERVPRDEQGKPMLDAVEPELALDAIEEKLPDGGSQRKFIENQIKRSKANLREAENVRSVDVDDIDAFAEAESARLGAIEQAKQKVTHWEAVEKARVARIEEAERAEREEAELAAAAEAQWQEEKKNFDKRLREVAEEVRDIPEALAILENTTPQTMDEVAAFLLSHQKVAWSNKSRDGRVLKYGVKSHVGIGEGERKKLFGLFASEAKGGVTIDRLAEDYFKEICDQYGVPYDNSEALNALIEVISGARTIGDIRNYIINNRMEQARRVAQDYFDYYERQNEAFYQENLKIGYEEYRDYEEQLMARFKDLDENLGGSDYYDIFADEIIEQNELENGITREEETAGGHRVENGGAEEAEPGGIHSGAGRGDEVLPAEEAIVSGRDKEVAEQRAGNEDRSIELASEGTVPESAPGRESEIKGQQKGDNDFKVSKGTKVSNEGTGGDLFSYFKGTIGELIQKSAEGIRGLIKKQICGVSDRLLKDLVSLGVDVSSDYSHVIDSDAIRHAMKQHGGVSESNRGQIALTNSDFEKIEDIVTNYDTVNSEEGKRGIPNIIYSKSYPDGTTVFIEEQRRGRKELAAVTMWKKKTSALTDANHNEVTPISDLSKGSVGKGSESAVNNQVKGAVIEDFGEEIAGARKNMLKEMSKRFEVATVQALIEQPFSKVVKRPDFGRAVAQGAMTAEEAMAAEALWQSVYSAKKPTATRSNASKVSKWAASTYDKIKRLEEFVNAEPERRRELMSALSEVSYPGQAAEAEHFNKIKGWNSDKQFAEPVFTPDAAWVNMEVMKRIGSQPGDKLTIPFSIATDSAHQQYELRDSSDNRLWRFKASRNIDDVLDAMALAVKISRGDTDIDYPVDCFRVKGEGARYAETGEYKVSYFTNSRSYNIAEKICADEQEARDFAAKLKAQGKEAAIHPVRKTTGEYDGYAVIFRNPVTDEQIQVGDSFSSLEDAQMALAENPQEFSDKVNALVEQANGSKSRREHFYVTRFYDTMRRKTRYSVNRTKDNHRVRTFESLAEADAWYKENKDRLEAERVEAMNKRRKFVYFERSEKPRVGKDYRGGKGVTPEQFTEEFGFRGVQFGNWTKGADRQAALNETYDALMDLAKVTGLSPKAISLNGELGLAFGARGMGGANAHYEPLEVVINLTKTRGAGSLAHEWWHALDNYLMRQSGEALLFATETINNKGRLGAMRPEVAEALGGLLSAVKGSGYDKRSNSVDNSAYWGSEIEETARLFAEWAVAKLGDSHASNHFLSRGIEPGVIDSYQRMNYAIYKAQCRNAEVSPMSFEEFSKTPEAMNGFPYPTAEEVKQFTPYIDKLFGAMQEQKSDKGMMIYEPGAEYGEGFDAVQERAVSERGIVMPGLADKSVRIVDVPRHDFSGTGKEALKKAEAWAKEHITGTHTATNSQGNEFSYTISNHTVEKFVSRSAMAKSENQGVHLAVLKKLPQIISSSLDVEVHPDYAKGDSGVRTNRNAINSESLIHRMYGAVKIENAEYRVKTTIREYKDPNTNATAHSYEVTKIELLEAPSDNAKYGTVEPLAMTSNSSIPAAKLLNGVEKSYDKGVKLLDVSEKSQESIANEGEGYWRSRQLGLFGGVESSESSRESLVDVEPTTRIDMRGDRDMADPEGEAANRAIDEYAERLWNDLSELESAESNEQAVEAIEERIHNATEELEGKLTEYYKSVGNLEHDAVQASRDMSRRVRAEVSVAMLKRRGESLEGSNKGFKVTKDSKDVKDFKEGEDNQGNPIDENGKLIVEDVKSIDEITDEDFATPTRTVGLPAIPENIDKAIGANGKRVIIKKNILVKNRDNHKDLSPKNSREILNTALYSPELYGQNQKGSRPYNWILIHLADKNTCVLLEVDNKKDNCEIINWHYLSGRQLEQKKRQAEREGGRILTLSEGNAAGNTSLDLSSDGKVREKDSERQVPGGVNQMRTAGGNVVSFEGMGGIRKLEEGEFTLVERKFSETGEFGFTGKERVESVDDVAYIFRALEDFSVENAFVVLVKDGVPTVVHLGMGDATQTLVNMDAAYASMKAFGADEVYFVHNHPNGTLRPSAPDENMCRRFESLFGDKLKGCLIMNLRSGKYCLFGGEEGTTVRQRPGDEGGETIRVKRFDRQVFSPGYEPERITSVTSSKVIAEFIASQRLGGRNKVSFLILNHANQIVGNIHTPYSSYSENAAGLADMMTENAVRFGGMKVVPYGNVGFDGLKPLAERIKNGGSTIRILDAVNVMNGLSYESAFDKSVMESAAPYSVAVDEPRVNEPAGSLGLYAAMSAALSRLANAQEENWQLRVESYRSIGGNLSNLLRAMSVQKEYDKRTVKAITDLAQGLLAEGQMADMKDGEVKRLLSAVRNATGRKNVDSLAEKVYDIMLNTQLRHKREIHDKLKSTKVVKLNNRGVEVQGKVDGDTATRLKYYKEFIANTDAVTDKILEGIEERTHSDNDSIKHKAELEMDAAILAKRYKELVADKEAEHKALSEEIRMASKDVESGLMTRSAFNEFKRETLKSMRALRAEISDGYTEIVGALQGVVAKGQEGARAFVQREKDRINKLYDMVNADMGWISSNIHSKQSAASKVVYDVLHGATSTLPSFNEMMKLLAQQHPGGRGELYDHFVPKVLKASEDEYINTNETMGKLGEFAGEILEKDKAKWEDLAKYARKWELKGGGKTMTLSWVDSNGLRDFKVGIPQLAYIYAVNKMEDGRIKLRRMGISEENVAKIKQQLPDEMIKIVDWLQEEFLPMLRDRYNAEYEKTYGTPMPEIKDYFPLKISKRERKVNKDLGAREAETQKSATTTGSIIARTRNSLAIDILNADVFNVVTEHVLDMEHWVAYNEVASELNALTAMPLFRNKVENMRTIFGSGEGLLKTFEETCLIVTGSFKQRVNGLDKLVNSISKGATAGKIAFRSWTALKQITSLPAFLGDASAVELTKAVGHAREAFNWCLENLPLFHKRWVGRMSGNIRLLPSDLDFGFWHGKIMETAMKIGMTPNAFVDALTVAIGSYATYNTQLKHYKEVGFSDEVAAQKAKVDATISFNETQQSSESAFVSKLQISKYVHHTALTVFRQANIGYQRKGVVAIRDLWNHFVYGRDTRLNSIKQKLIADGINPTKAEEIADRVYTRSIIRSIITASVMSFGVTLAWYLFGNLPYYIFGKDEDEKNQKLKEDFVHAALDGVMQGLPMGDVVSSGLTALLTGTKLNSDLLRKDIPFVTDAYNIIDKFGYDKIGAWNDLANVAIQCGVGANPQTFTDAVVALWDYCGQDARTSQEFAILMMRILQMPQSQLDKIYFDELDVTGEQAKKMTPQEVAKRYAAYKVRRGATLLYGFYDDEARDKRISSYEKRAISTIKDQMSALWSNEVNAAYDEYSAINKEYKAMAKAVVKGEQMNWDETVYSSENRGINRRLHNKFDRYNKTFSRLSMGFVTSKTPEQANRFREALRWFKPKMIELMDAVKSKSEYEEYRIVDEITLLLEQSGFTEEERSKIRNGGF